MAEGSHMIRSKFKLALNNFRVTFVTNSYHVHPEIAASDYLYMVTEKNKKKLFSWSNVFTALLIVFAAGMLFFPNFKAKVLQGLMKVGLFQPVVEKHQPSTTEKNWNVSFSNSKGETIEGNALKNKVVFVNTWATWCPPCIAEMPSVDELYKTYGTNPNAIFLLIDADNNLQKAENFMQQKGFKLPVFIANTNMPSEWFEGTLPTTVVLDKNGNIAFKEAGAANYNSIKFKTFIDGLLKE